MENNQNIPNNQNSGSADNDTYDNMGNGVVNSHTNYRKRKTKRIAIITGASSGIGKEFAHQIDARQELDEIWLIARNESALAKVANELRNPACIVGADLTQEKSQKGIQKLLEDEQPCVTYLVNAAGFGKFGDWETISNEDAASMINLNCRALVELTQTTLPYMSRGSRIIQVASASAFLPLAHMNVYAATKAFALRYTRALRWELHFTGITATALCPTWVKTGFEKTARRSNGGNDVRHLIGAQKPSTIVRRALIANRLHAAVVCASIQAFLLRILGQILPNCITMPFWELLRRI